MKFKKYGNYNLGLDATVSGQVDEDFKFPTRNGDGKHKSELQTQDLQRPSTVSLGDGVRLKTLKAGQTNLGFEDDSRLHHPVKDVDATQTTYLSRDYVVTDGDGSSLGPPSASEGDSPERMQWNNQVEFLLSCVAMSVGLGNVWRFPFVAYENGGGAFLIPYLVVLFLIGKPLYFMELAIGQFSSSGPVKVWKCVPILKGIGFGQAITTFYVATYYNSLMATCLFYFGSCFQSVLPWTKCDSRWGADENCVDKLAPMVNESSTNETNITLRQSAAEQYYEKYVLRMSAGIDEIGPPDYRLALCLLVCWVFLFFCLIKSVQSSGKTAYVTAIFPYIVMITLLILGSTLEGAGQGVMYFITPKWKDLLTARVWYKAVEQSFFSLAVGFGNLTMFSSYNPFRHHVYRDAMIVSIMDTLTSLLAGFTIFSILGSMSVKLHLPIEDVIRSAAGLAFVAYPQALAEISFVPQLWTVLFFLMLFTLGIGSSVAQIGNVLTIVCDELPKVKVWHAGLVICIVCYGIGLVYVTPNGQYIQNLVDSYGAGFTVVVYGTLEVIAVMWIYGLKRFCHDIEFMLGSKISRYWKACWLIVVPITLLVIFIYMMATLSAPKLGKYIYPPWANYLGWSFSAVALIQIPLWAIKTVYDQKGHNLLDKFLVSLRPTSDWGPRLAKDRMEWEASKLL